MYARGEPVVGDQPAEKSAEDGPIRRGQGSKEVLAVLLRDPADVPYAVVTRGSQVQRVVASVRRVATTLDETLPLRLVDERHEAAG